MFCMKCGQELPEEAMFCFKCGTPTSKNVENSVKTFEGKDDEELPIIDTSIPNESKGFNKKAIYGIVAAFVFIFAIVVAIVLKVRNNQVTQKKQELAGTWEAVTRYELNAGNGMLLSDASFGLELVIGEDDKSEVVLRFSASPDEFSRSIYQYYKEKNYPVESDVVKDLSTYTLQIDWILEKQKSLFSHLENTKVSSQPEYRYLNDENSIKLYDAEVSYRIRGKDVYLGNRKVGNCYVDGLFLFVEEDAFKELGVNFDTKDGYYVFSRVVDLRGLLSELEP